MAAFCWAGGARSPPCVKPELLTSLLSSAHSEVAPRAPPVPQRARRNSQSTCQPARCSARSSSSGGSTGGVSSSIRRSRRSGGGSGSGAASPSGPIAAAVADVSGSNSSSSSNSRSSRSIIISSSNGAEAPATPADMAADLRAAGGRAATPAAVVAGAQPSESARSTAPPSSSPSSSSSAAAGGASSALRLACPICHRALQGSAATAFTLDMAARTRYTCTPCARTYPSSERFVDMVVTSGVREYVEPMQVWGGTETFRSPVVSFVYERGWRQSFAGFGFPGPDEEFAKAQSLLLPVARGDTVLDVSCGSGLFTRRFAASGQYARVVAVDFSENMLRQVQQYVEGDNSVPAEKVAAVRADVARLPFETGSVAGVHAGAALHCWPSPWQGVAEISRVLKPGGVFVATTILSPKAPIIDDLIKPFRKAAISAGRVMKYWEEEELEELMAVCGLVDYQCDIRNQYIFLSARKPTRD